MPKIWRNRILAGDKSYDKCPPIYKSAVKKLLQKDVNDGLITAEDFEQFIGGNMDN